jgi:hypothetical protein
MADRGRFDGLVISFPGARKYVRFHLVSVRQAIHLVEKADYSQDFSQAFIVQPQPLHGGGVRVDSVRAAVGNRDSQSNDFLGQQVDFAGPHDGLEPAPTKLQVLGVSRQGPPDIRHPLDFLGGLDVLENGSDCGIIGFFIHEFHGAHDSVPSL